MTSALPSFGHRHRHRRRLRALALAGVVAAGAALVGGSASAAGTGTLTPYVNCVTVNQAGIVTAYFGYDNTTGASHNVAIGENNQLFPTSPFEGQPDVFNQGNYPQVFSVTFDPALLPTVAWILNGQEADAGADGPRCANGVSSPATDVTGTSATLTGVVVPSGTDTTYSFAYGTTAALGSSTPTQDFGAGTQPGLVQAAVSGLTANTRYYFRIDTSGSATNTQGKTLSFTTAAPAAPLAISTPRLGDGKVGSAYQAQLVGVGGTQPYSWSVTSGALPAGLLLNGLTGVISGKPLVGGTFPFGLRVSDQSLPTAKTVTGAFSITVDQFKKKSF